MFDTWSVSHNAPPNNAVFVFLHTGGRVYHGQAGTVREAYKGAYRRYRCEKKYGGELGRFMFSQFSAPVARAEIARLRAIVNQ